MTALCTSRYWDLSSLFRGGAFCLSRNGAPLTSLDQFFHFQGNLAYSSANGSLNSIVVPPALLEAQKDEAKSVLTLFLKKNGLTKAVTARTINKSDHFVDHLVSRLHSVHKSRYLVGGELSTLEIKDMLFPYLESLLEEHGNGLRNLVENFPDAAVKEKLAASDFHPHDAHHSKKPKAVSPLSDTVQARELRPQVIQYLIELGLDLEQIKVITRRFPNFSYCSLERKIKPLVEFLLDLGVPKSCMPKILCQSPQLCGLQLSDNVIPSMRFLEDLGVDKKKWSKILYHFPQLLCASRQKVQAVVNFLYELHLSGESIGKILTQSPNIVSLSVEDNLRPKVEFFQSLGLDIAILLCRSPKIFSFNIEGKVKPVTQFFLVRGYSVEEVRAMISRFPVLFNLSLAENLIPKWEFFLTMGYSKLELVKYPQYFGLSLEHRIRPRDALVKKLGVKLSLSQLLSLSEYKLEEILKMKREKMLCDKGMQVMILNQ